MLNTPKHDNGPTDCKNWQLDHKPKLYAAVKNHRPEFIRQTFQMVMNIYPQI